MYTEKTTKYKCAYTDAYGQQTCDELVVDPQELDFDKVKKTKCSEARCGFGSCAGGIAETTEDERPADTLCSTHQAEVEEARNEEDDNEYEFGSGAYGGSEGSERRCVYRDWQGGYEGSGGSGRAGGYGGGIGTG